MKIDTRAVVAAIIGSPVGVLALHLSSQIARLAVGVLLFAGVALGSWLLGGRPNRTVVAPTNHRVLVSGMTASGKTGDPAEPMRQAA